MANPLSRIRDKNKGSKLLKSILLDKVISSTNIVNLICDSDIELTLSGHTHAMQMEIFGHSLSSLIYPEWSGMYYEGKRALYVNVGIGYVGLPFRFGAWPEVTVIKLVSEKE